MSQIMNSVQNPNLYTFQSAKQIIQAESETTNKPSKLYVNEHIHEIIPISVKFEWNKNQQE